MPSSRPAKDTITYAPDVVLIDNYTKVACTAACKLSSLLKKSKHAKLLRQPPPAIAGDKHAELLQQSLSHARSLKAAVCACPTTAAAIDAFLAALLQPHKPAAALGTLVAWLKPQHLEVSAILDASQSVAVCAGTPTTCWMACFSALKQLCSMAYLAMHTNTDHARNIVLQFESVGMLRLFSSMQELLGLLLACAEASRRPVACDFSIGLLEVLSMLLTLLQCAPDSAATAAHTLLPLLQQAQRCVALLPPSAAGEALVTSSNSNELLNAITTDHDKQEALCRCIVNVQQQSVSAAAGHLTSSVLPSFAVYTPLQVSDELAAAALQLLSAYGFLLQRQHTLQLLHPVAVTVTQRARKQQKQASKQQQPRQQPGDHDNEPPGKQMSVQAAQCSLKLLPRCQAAYIEAFAFVCDLGDQSLARSMCSPALSKDLACLLKSLQQHVHGSTAQQEAAVDSSSCSSSSSSPALTADAVQLATELLLQLAAGVMQEPHQAQRQQQEGQQQEGQQQQGPTGPGGHNPAITGVTAVFQDCSSLQALQLQSLNILGLQATCTSIVQQCGLQLLQSLHCQLHEAVRGALPYGAAGLLDTLLKAGGVPKDSLVDNMIDFDQGVVVSPCPQLTSLAAQHPVEYFSFIDSSIRAGLAVPGIFLAAALLRYGLSQPFGAAVQLLGDPAAVQAAGSAVASLVKLAAHVTNMESVAAEAGAAVSQSFSAILTCLVSTVLTPLSKVLLSVDYDWCEVSSSSSTGSKAAVQQSHVPAKPPDNGAGGSCCCTTTGNVSSQQFAASSVFLAVLLARSLVVLADAVDAAAAAARTTPAYLVSQSVAAPKSTPVDGEAPMDVGGDSEAECWQMFQCGFVRALVLMPNLLLRPLPLLLQQLLEAKTVAGPVVAASGASACCEPPRVPPDVGSSSIHQQQQGAVQWAYLLQLHNSRKLTSAVTALLSKWPCNVSIPALEEANNASEATDPEAAARSQERIGRMYRDMLRLCRVLAGAAPLPLLCNHPGCVNLSGVSEASVAVKVCGGCRARYCSPACQAAHWRQHKKACRRMAALGLVVGK